MTAPQHDPSATPAYAAATVRLLIENGARPWGLWLLSRGGPSSTAREALRALHAQVRDRIRVQAEALREPTPAMDASERERLAARVDAAAALVLPALQACRARGAQAFMCWLDQRIGWALTDAPLDAPPAAGRPALTLLASNPLPTSADAPRAHLAAVLRALPSLERRVLEYRAAAGGATWARVGAQLGMSAQAARLLHARALAHARRAALDLLAEESPAHSPHRPAA